MQPFQEKGAGGCDYPCHRELSAGDAPDSRFEWRGTHRDISVFVLADIALIMIRIFCQ
jgi:hypothetical protein